MDDVRIRPVTLENKGSLLAFDYRVLNELDTENPFLVSFANDEVKIEQALLNPELSIYFVVEATLTGSIIARCGLNLNPSADDICAYGKAARKVFHAYPDEMASMVGDLVDPTFRGRSLQSAMIHYRLAWLKDRGYRFAVAGVIDGNDISKDNYIAAGFELLGRKNITWDVEYPFTSSVILYGRTLCSVVN